MADRTVAGTAKHMTGNTAGRDASATVLLIGGIDSSGGAGLMRDAGVIARLGLRPCLAVTALTAQSDRAVTAVAPTDPAMIEAQIRAAITAALPAAIKTGMLCSHDAAGVVADMLALMPAHVPLVVDPVLRASSGRALIAGDAVAVLTDRLLPRAHLVTPNLPELRALAPALGLRPDAAEERIAQAMIARGAGAVLIKGGHGDDPARCTDLLFRPGQPVQRFGARRLPVSMRGTGCHLASAIAAHLALGAGLEPAIRAARADLLARLRASVRPG
ncbi:MAG: hydroxymethylpyrimidine/phosphomethylpyrimidine kinase [Paracoccus sp. (in: a-proteobacteria)]|nr:hydroxymethylpyrimidine/phosphomethylpyrimidine kinase [Paracoccus sp. (in: a-proteobacteria)]